MDESPLAFVERWTTDVRTLQAAVEAKSAPVGASEQVQALSQQLTARSGDIPLSELGRCEREIKALQDALSSSKAAPKAKFSFKRSAAAKSAAASSASAPKPLSSAPVPSAPALPAPSVDASSAPVVPAGALTLSGHTDAYLSAADLPSSPSSSSSSAPAIALSSLTHCFVDLLPTSSSPASSTSFGAVYLSDLKECVVLLPPSSSGSILVQSCSNCVLVLSGHQFRMHDSTACRIFLRAGSTPIIERCRALVFGGYPQAFLPESDFAAPPKTVQDFDDPFADPSAGQAPKNWRPAGKLREDYWAGWERGEGRRGGWKGLLEGMRSGTA
ncbi:hypothetical protein JCM8097_002139 [Rhodosporidiobolus ruineniae]